MCFKIYLIPCRYLYFLALSYMQGLLAPIGLCENCPSKYSKTYCCYYIFYHNRDMSRTVIIPFNLPKIGAESESDCQFYQTLGDLRKEVSSCIGWAISLRKKLKATGISMINSKYLPKIFSKINGVEPRVITGYSILLYFVDEVCNQTCLQLYPLYTLCVFPFKFAAN